MQKAVGGYIELVRLAKPAFVFVNEDRLALKLPSNPRASHLLGRRIVGPAVVCDVSEVE